MRALVKSCLFSAILVLSLICVAGAQIIYFPSVPPLMTVQGKLTDASGDPLADGSYNVGFIIWNSSTGGDAVWGDTLTVETTDGLFSAVLGSDITLTYDVFDSQFRWLGIQVESDPEMTPRQRLTAVPYAMSAHNLDLNTVESGHIVNGSITNADIAADAEIDMSKIFGGTGVDYSTRTLSIEATTSTTEVLSVTIDCPTSGYVILMFSGQATIYGENTMVEVGVGSSGAPFAFSQELGHNPTETTYYVQSFCPIYTVSVLAGTWTYTANARKSSVFDDYSVYIDQASLTALFVPSRY